METIKFGNTGKIVSRLGFGAMRFGPDDDQGIEAVKRAQGCVPGEIMGIDYDEEFPLEISDEDKEYPLRAEISKPALTLLERRGVDSVKVYEKLIADLARVDPRMLEYAKKLFDKKQIFKEQTGTKKTLFTTMITTYGAKQNNHYNSVVSTQLTMDSLFNP